jgi:hypothetical protein
LTRPGFSENAQSIAIKHDIDPSTTSGPVPAPSHDVCMQTPFPALPLSARHGRGIELAERRWREAAQAWEQAAQALARDAEDLALPSTRPALNAIALALQTFGEGVHALATATRELREAQAEEAQQRAREQEAVEVAQSTAEQAAERLALAEEAQIHWQTLQESIGAEVDELQRRLAEVRRAVGAGQTLWETQQ